MITLYRKLCPSCARELAREARQCDACGYVEPGASGDAEEEQERLYGEYLMARLKQATEVCERLRREIEVHPEDKSRNRRLVEARAELVAVERELRQHRGEQPALRPQRAKGDKTCPACSATLPIAVSRCACGHVFGLEVSPLRTCPHCTAVVAPHQERCTCGYPLGAGPQLPTLGGIAKNSSKVR